MLRQNMFSVFWYKTKARYRMIVFRSSARKEAFLLREVTTAVLKPLGIPPSISEQLNNIVIDGSNMSLHSLISNVDHRSSRQNFAGEFLIILSTAYSDIWVKSVIFGGLGGWTSFSVPEGTKLCLISMQTRPQMTYQTHGMEVSLQEPYLGFYTAHAIAF